MSDLPFALERQKTYAALTPADLETMGKQASDMYLRMNMSLNTAIAKLAAQHPSISPHQVRRVVEFANQNTFQALFEKQAGDKNIEFDIADPGVILRDINDGARPVTVSATPSEYGEAPVKLGHTSLEADLQLCELFGFTPATSSIKKVATGKVDGLLKNAPNSAGDLHTRLSKGEKLFYKIGSPEEKVRELLEKNPNPDDEEVHALAEDMGMEPDDLEEIIYGMLSKEISKEGMAYIRSGRDSSGFVQRDLQDAVSLESIKEATDRAHYREENPHRDLLATRQMLQKIAGDVYAAVDKNELLLKEATEHLTQCISQEVLSGGNLGEVAHAMGSVASPEWVKLAMQHAVPALILRGVDPVTLQSRAVQYEMEKGASIRPANLDNELLQVFSSFVKLSRAKPVLEKAQEKVASMLAEVTDLVQQVARRCHVTSIK